jgi:hypothetical protein
MTCNNALVFLTCLVAVASSFEITTVRDRFYEYAFRPKNLLDKFCTSNFGQFSIKNNR